MEQVHTDQRASIAVPSAPQVGPALVCFQCHWGSGQTPSFLQVPAPQEEVSIPTPTLICKTLRRREGEFQKSAAGHRVGTFASSSDLAAQMPIPICVCALVTQIARVLGLYSRGKRPGRVPAEVPRLPKVSPLGGLYTIWRVALRARKPLTNNWTLWSALPWVEQIRTRESRRGVASSGSGAATLGEFLLPATYSLDEPCPLGIGIVNFSMV